MNRVAITRLFAAAAHRGPAQLRIRAAREISATAGCGHGSRRICYRCCSASFAIGGHGRVNQLPPLFTTGSSNGGRLYCSANETPLSRADFDQITDEVLERIAGRVDELVASASGSQDYDVTLASGVLTLSLGRHGTYVINKQTPNRQIWLSSPLSGPKRYDYAPASGQWVYSHDGSSLHGLLNSELSAVFDSRVDFTDCSVYRV